MICSFHGESLITTVNDLSRLGMVIRCRSKGDTSTTVPGRSATKETTLRWVALRKKNTLRNKKKHEWWNQVEEAMAWWRHSHPSLKAQPIARPISITSVVPLQLVSSATRQAMPIAEHEGQRKGMGQKQWSQIVNCHDHKYHPGC